MTSILPTAVEEDCVRHRRIGFWYRLAVTVVKPLLLVFTSRQWRGAANLPRSGGVIVAANHISYVDPLTLAHFLYDNGRLPRFLAKSTLFEVPVLKWVFNGAHQIPVKRGTTDAAAALTAAVDALDRGECVLIYPEGTATRDPHTWPMVARTGIARLALTTGAPVIPVAQWGAQQILPYPAKRPHLLPRARIKVVAGPPVDLSRFEGKEQTTEVLREATDEIMRRITEMLADLRGEPAPPVFFDPRRAA
jgi:1-acyl-sn-glycerol-3-phosphate acyltransferase